jgi:hypothetical protein
VTAGARVMAIDPQRSIAHRSLHGGTTLLNEPYAAAGITRHNIMPIRPRRDLCPLAEMFFWTTTTGQGRCELCGKRLTAHAAKPFRASAFPTQFTPQPQQSLVSNEKEKRKRFCLPKPRLETLRIPLAECAA